MGTPWQMCTNDENRDFRQKRAFFTKENGPFFRDFSVVFIYICPKRAFFTKENGHFFPDFGDKKSQNVTFGRLQRNPEKIYIICKFWDSGGLARSRPAIEDHFHQKVTFSSLEKARFHKRKRKKGQKVGGKNMTRIYVFIFMLSFSDVTGLLRPFTSPNESIKINM